MIIVYELPGLWGLPSVSPFCLKLTTWLRLRQIPYESRIGGRDSPKGKLPWIQYNGEAVADTGVIIARLDRELPPSLDAHLSVRERALHHLVRRTIEESAYFALIYQRWQIDENFAAFKPVFDQIPVPGILRAVVTRAVRARVLKSLYAQGIGRHPPDDIERMLLEDLRAVCEVLGPQRFFGGNEPTNIDASAYGFLAQLYHQPMDSSARRFVLESPLKHYVERMRQRVWPETVEAAEATSLKKA